MSKLLSRCTVDSPGALMAALNESRIDVSERGAGRTSHQTERWIIAHFLSTLNATGELSFPLTWGKQERPDYFVSWAARHRGIEVSELVSPAFAQAVAVRNQEFPGIPIDPSLFKPSDAPSSRERVRALLDAGAAGYGWSGNSVEREWAEAVVQRASEKSAKLAEPGYSLYSDNWLLLYDNLPGPLLNLDEAVALAHVDLKSCLVLRPAFNLIWVLSNGYLVAVDADSVRRLPVSAPWAA